MRAMVERDAKYTLSGDVQVDEAYFGGELVGGKAGRGSENKVPFVTAISLSAEGRPLCIKMVSVPGFTRKSIVGWANAAGLAPGCVVSPDGLGCFVGVTNAGCHHRRWSQAQGLVGIKLDQHNFGKSQNQPGGAYHAFDFAKYGTRYLCAFSSLWSLLGLVRHTGYAKLKHLANQDPF